MNGGEILQKICFRSDTWDNPQKIGHENDAHTKGYRLFVIPESRRKEDSQTKENQARKDQAYKANRQLPKHFTVIAVVIDQNQNRNMNADNENRKN